MKHSDLLSVSEALEKVLGAADVLDAEVVDLTDALGRVLAQDVVAQDHLPPFANSAMDGFAVRSSDVDGASPENPVRLEVIEDIGAGTVPQCILTANQAARIMTGAVLPRGADSIVPVEETDAPWRQSGAPLPDTVAIKQAASPGDHVRLPGEDIRQGETVLQAGRLLRPQEIGVLAATGYASVRVVKKPRVGILATGDELIEVDQPLPPGKIRNSNSHVQNAQVMQLGAEALSLGIAPDNKDDVVSRLAEGLARGVDLIISSAGVSVGAYDVVKDVLQEGGTVGFWRVNMRPGKPLAFGHYHDVPYLGLPGNPVSAMVSFEIFARPAILKMAGHRHLDRPAVRAVVQEELRSDGRESYIRAVIRKVDGKYEALSTGQQGSHMLTSLVLANALLVIPAGTTMVPRGSELSAIMIDWPNIVF